MAVQAVTVTSELIVNVENGVNAQGNPILAARRYRNVKPSATSDDVYAVGQTLAGLQEKPVAGIQRRDVADLENV
ncbi:MAG TPA: DUF1659 domain-containing protein [Syntrophothermus lipocalidus]|uniref:DUF1659 domain-containing protein n=1 Tax=Syntrophothermus lipocalidus (strain DSM 12680 / TGB-C1) TaxID=643648 RepID=D7CMS0_SYNLT|nr:MULTISPECIES: DUF1659 domain-containing protein [Syntrophothermus]ADI02005.1 protein of unknown function DUF1659 [Syntrophothermus lipocalidus DSM 12680]NSW83887.1 DUF1659 domain-containing protein [Syntrophothermus sp.]HHV76687.1 DUF1659 domain-containing protein [Syntrophothermus lipocalidus]HOV42553.1 DUF1659 domain-containing protein [Syntrophothermus lipocalidus]